jgi:hypothetical protein
MSEGRANLADSRVRYSCQSSNETSLFQGIDAPERQVELTELAQGSLAAWSSYMDPPISTVPTTRLEVRGGKKLAIDWSSRKERSRFMVAP